MDLKQLTFLRFIAAVGVLLFHFHAGVPSLAWGVRIWTLGDTAVSFFFFLSGFILTFVYAQRGIRDRTEFYVARFARIAPLYLIALCAIALIELSRGVLSWKAFVLSALMVQAWVPGYSQVINTPGWSLSVEWFLYLSFPLLLSLLLRVRSSSRLGWLMVGIWAGSIGLCAVSVQLAPEGIADSTLVDLLDYHPLVHLPTFLVGIIAGLLFVRHREAFTRVAVPLSCLALLAAVGILLFTHQPFHRYQNKALLAPAYVACICGLATMRDNWLVRTLSHPSLVLLGEISYGIYILQKPIGNYFMYVLNVTRVKLSPDAHFWIVFPLIIVGAWISHQVIEIPLRDRIKDWTRPWLKSVSVGATKPE